MLYQMDARGVGAVQRDLWVGRPDPLPLLPDEAFPRPVCGAAWGSLSVSFLHTPGTGEAGV